MELPLYGFFPLFVEFIGPCESASAGMLPACHAHLYIWPWASSSRASSLSTLLSPLGEKMSRFSCVPVDYKRGPVPHVPRGFLLFPMGLSPKILLFSCHITAEFGP